MTYNKNDIFKNVKSAILELHPEFSADNITRKTNFSHHLRCDSYDKIEIAMCVAKIYKTRFTDYKPFVSIEEMEDFCKEISNMLNTETKKTVLVKKPQMPIIGNIKDFFKRQK